METCRTACQSCWAGTTLCDSIVPALRFSVANGIFRRRNLLNAEAGLEAKEPLVSPGSFWRRRPSSRLSRLFLQNRGSESRTETEIRRDIDPGC
jgi:hypothetical protein